MNRVKIFLGILAFAGLSLGAKAQVTVVDSDTCGVSLTWTFYSDSTFIISGSGAIPDYAVATPWNAYKNAIKTIIIGDSVTSIGTFAFHSCYILDSIKIGNGVTSIERCAFENCMGLTSIVIPNSVITIGDEVFYGCQNLTSVTIGNNVTSIGSQAFVWCRSLGSINIPNSVTDIGMMAFFRCNSLKLVTIGLDVTRIGSLAFFYCDSLHTVNFNAMNCASDSLGAGVFAGCNVLTTLNIGNRVKIIPAYFFHSCYQVTSVIIPDSVIDIGKGGFAACTGLTSVTIGNAVATIGDSAFYNCTGLISLTIPDSVASIGIGAFRSCTGLTSIISEAMIPPALGSNAFSGVTTTIPVIIPCGTKTAYKSTSWNYFSNIRGKFDNDTAVFDTKDGVQQIEKFVKQ